MLSLTARPGGKRESNDGIAALEFALVVPVMITICLGLYDIATAFLASQRVNLAAAAIAQIATYQAAATTDANANVNILNLTKAQIASSAIYAYLPDTLPPSPSPFAVVITSVVITPPPTSCGNSCAYIPNVAWSGRYQGSASSGPMRSCGGSALAWVDDRAASSPTTLPTHLQQSQPLLVVDVYYTYRPFFFAFITGPIAMMGSAYFSPRTGLPGDWVQYYFISGSSDTTINCLPNYPWSIVNP